MLEADVVRALIFPVMLTGTVLIWRSHRFVAGRLLMLIGALHLLGFWVGREPLLRIAANGFLNQADSGVGNVAAKADQELVFWFLLWGPFTIMLGQLIVVLERRGVRPPSWFGWQLGAVSLAAALLMPKGGFWWMLLPAYRLIRQRG